MPPVMPAPKLPPVGPRITTWPPVMYSQPLAPQPSTTVVAPELRTAKRSPAWPAANSRPEVAPNSTVLPIRVLVSGAARPRAGLITIVAPDRPLPT